ncbi:MAG: diacylglycerol kinase family protein [bacterium]
METKEKKAFSLIARIGSFRHAFRGIYVFVKNTHNAWVEIFFNIIFILLGFYFSITKGEWLALIIAIFVLIMAEAFNTAMEVHMDLTSPGQHPYARDTKDIAAGAVLISVFLVIITVLIIFAPYVGSFLAK